MNKSEALAKEGASASPAVDVQEAVRNQMQDIYEEGIEQEMQKEGWEGLVRGREGPGLSAEEQTPAKEAKRAADVKEQVQAEEAGRPQSQLKAQGEVLQREPMPPREAGGNVASAANGDEQPLGPASLAASASQNIVGDTDCSRGTTKPDPAFQAVVAKESASQGREPMREEGEDQRDERQQVHRRNSQEKRQEGSGENATQFKQDSEVIEHLAEASGLSEVDDVGLTAKANRSPAVVKQQSNAQVSGGGASQATVPQRVAQAVQKNQMSEVGAHEGKSSKDFENDEVIIATADQAQGSPKQMAELDRRQQAYQELLAANQMVNEQGGTDESEEGAGQRSGEDGSRRSEGPKEGEERGGGIQALGSSSAGVSGSCRSDLKSRSSAIASGSLPSKDVPLEYTMTQEDQELRAKLAATANATTAAALLVGLDAGVNTIPEVAGEDQLQSPKQEASKDIDTVGIRVEDQDGARQQNISEPVVLAASAALLPLNRDINSLMTVSQASEQMAGPDAYGLAQTPLEEERAEAQELVQPVISGQAEQPTPAYGEAQAERAAPPVPRQDKAKKAFAHPEPFDPDGPEAAAANIPFEPTVKGQVADAEADVQRCPSAGIRDHIDQPDSDDGLEDGKKLDKLLHRLPNNYFVQDDDEEDINTVMNNIQNMRHQMLDYVQETEMDHQLQKDVADIADIIEPQKFIEKHYSKEIEKDRKNTAKAEKQRGGDAPNIGQEAAIDEPPKFLFEEILKEPVVLEARDLKDQEQQERIFENTISKKSLDVAKKADSSPGPKQESASAKKPPIDFWGGEEGEPGESMNRGMTEEQLEEIVRHSQREREEDAQAQSYQARDFAGPSELTNNSHGLAGEAHENDRFERSIPFIGPEAASMGSGHQPAFSGAFPKSQAGPRVMKMADYFQEGQSPALGPSGDLQHKTPNMNTSFNSGSLLGASFHENALLASGPPVPLPFSQMEGALSLGSFEAQWATASGPRGLGRPQAASAEQQQRANLMRQKKVEEEILRNVDINFLFTKGRRLHEGLIDPRRVHQIVGKIKELAREQVQKGSKDINYMELVEFLKKKDLGFVGAADGNDAFAEPEPADLEEQADEQWDQVVTFMRNNPKLLMQMVPDGEEPPDYRVPHKGSQAMRQDQHQENSAAVQQADLVLKRSRVYDKIQEAQKWQKLQQLSQSFNQKRRQAKIPPRKSFVSSGPPSIPPPLADHGASTSANESQVVKDYKRAMPSDKLIGITSNLSHASRKTAILEPIPSARQLSKQRLPSIKSREQAAARPTQKQQELRKPPVAGNQRRNKAGAEGQSEDAKGPELASSKPPKQFGATRSQLKAGALAEKEKDGEARGGTSKRTEDEDHKSKKSGTLFLQKIDSDYQQTRIKTGKAPDSQRPQDARQGERGQVAHDASAASSNRKPLSKDRNTRQEPGQSVLQHRSVASNSSLGRSTLKDDAHSKDELRPQKQLPKFVDPNQYQILQQRAQRHQNSSAAGSGAAIGPFFGDKVSPDESVQYQPKVFQYSRCGSVADAQAPEILKSDIQALDGGAAGLQNRTKRFGRPVTANNDNGSFFRHAGSSAISGTDDAARLGLAGRPVQGLGGPAAARLASEFELNVLEDQPMAASKDRYISSDNNFRQKAPLQAHQKKVWPSGNLPSAPGHAPVSTKHAIRVASMRTRAGQKLPAVGSLMHGVSSEFKPGQPPKFIQPADIRGRNFEARKIVIAKRSAASETVAGRFGPARSPKAAGGQAQGPERPSRVHDKGRSRSKSFGESAGRRFRPAKLSPSKEIQQDVTMFQSLSDKQMAAQLESGKKDRTRSRSPKKREARGGDLRRKSPAGGKRTSKSRASRTGSPPHELWQPTQNSPLASTHQKRVDFGSGVDETASLRAQASRGALKGKNERMRSAKGSATRSRSGKRRKGDKGSNTATQGGIQCEVQTQTDLRGVEHRILVRAKEDRPDEAGNDVSDIGKIRRDKSTKIEIEENKSRPDGTGRHHGTFTEYLGENKPPRQVEQELVVQSHDQSTSLLAAPQDLPVQPHPLYRANEIEIVLEHIKTSYKDFKRTDMMKPFYLKALSTLRKLLQYLGKEETYRRVCREYREITLENTIKLLLRCRLAYAKIKSTQEQNAAIMMDDTEVGQGLEQIQS